MKLHSLAKAAITAIALAATAGASAATYDLGVIAAGDPPTSFNAWSGGSGMLTAFSDRFNFTIETAGITGGSVVEFRIPTLMSAVFTSANLYTAAGELVASATGSASSVGFAGTLTPAGSYYFEVIGDAAGTQYAAYSGAISVALAPVPEPATYGMMLAGLGLVGTVVARRRKSKSE